MFGFFFIVSGLFLILFISKKYIRLIATVEAHSQVGVTVSCDPCRNSGHGISCSFAPLAESCSPSIILSKFLSDGDTVK